MCHLLLFWTEAEDTLFSLARGKEKNSSLFSSGFMRVPVFLLALHLLLEFGNPEHPYLSHICTHSLILLQLTLYALDK